MWWVDGMDESKRDNLQKSGNHDEVLIHTAQLSINLVNDHDPLGQ